MSLTVLEISQQEALEAAGLVCLPDALDRASSIVWLKAIGLVRKVNGTRNYVLLENDGEKPRIKRDFGAVAAIIDIVEIYPYETLEKRFIPSISSAADAITYLKAKASVDVSLLLDDKGKTFEQIKTDRSRVRKMIMEQAMAYAQTTLNDELKYKQYYSQTQEENEKAETANVVRKNKRGRKPNPRK
jgi:hypothetical protein